MAWKSYDLDRIAQKLVLEAKANDAQSLNQSYKMRMAVSHGLERFWGEHLRLSDEQEKADYWKATWDKLVEIMARANVCLPNDPVVIRRAPQNEDKAAKKEREAENTRQVRVMAEKLWDLGVEEQRITLAILIQLCDCMVWWTQRYK
jgi:hypothetical protein